MTPEAAGLARSAPAALKGGDPAHNAEALIEVLDGAPGAYRDIGLINAGAALVVAGKAGFAQGRRGDGRGGDPLRRRAAHA